MALIGTNRGLAGYSMVPWIVASVAKLANLVMESIYGAVGHYTLFIVSLVFTHWGTHHKQHSRHCQIGRARGALGVSARALFLMGGVGLRRYFLPACVVDVHRVRAGRGGSEGTGACRRARERFIRGRWYRSEGGGELSEAYGKGAGGAGMDSGAGRVAWAGGAVSEAARPAGGLIWSLRTC